MKKLILYLIISTSSLFSIQTNLLIIKDKSGKVQKGKRIHHTNNIYYSNLIKEQQKLLKKLNKLKKEEFKVDIMIRTLY